ncbi:thiamine-phosphate pyrophosphorylase [Pedobacter steynii]|uniref:Thiamine-phosphate synthase n=1 Tax=Pedobacter steynii TaxID=430522 RepID=A0A1H0M7D4_9SPHI|nr:thiamine phosphate synthase [Pedobacter steynii]NQX43599.1 thiamine phosphate synthase [Pedobacter steynii]SDO76255.1 thiamine-phosphate pyrophosphorylase [Pedobacter steynii]
MKKFIEKLHFITHDIPQHSHIEQVRIACGAGAKWVQYRCLTKNDEELLEDINAIAEICDDWGATLIVTDHIHLNGKADIQGFHIEDMDADFVKLREQLGEAITIGGSSNTLEGLIRLAEEGADYAGFGPFYTTTTKPNNAPLLGVEGYLGAMQVLKEKSIDLPVLAVGGITLSDVDPLMNTGIFGIAVSASINQAEDMREAYLDFYDQLK